MALIVSVYNTLHHVMVTWNVQSGPLMKVPYCSVNGTCLCSLYTVCSAHSAPLSIVFVHIKPNTCIHISHFTYLSYVCTLRQYLSIHIFTNIKNTKHFSISFMIGHGILDNITKGHLLNNARSYKFDLILNNVFVMIDLRFGFKVCHV